MRLYEKMPEFAGVKEWLNGAASKEELKRVPVLVYFWSISCETCKESLPGIKQWHEKYKGSGLRVIGIHMPRSEEDTDVEKVKQAVAEWGIKDPTAIDNLHAMTDLYENQYVPAFYLFDEEGKLRHYQAGAKGAQMLEQRLEKIAGVGV